MAEHWVRARYSGFLVGAVSHGMVHNREQRGLREITNGGYESLLLCGDIAKGTST